MFRANGLYGHIQNNHVASLIMFTGFVLAGQLISAAVLLLPLLIYDYELTFIYDLPRYLRNFALPTLAVTIFVFALRYMWHLQTVQGLARFRLVSKFQEPRFWRLAEIQSMSAGIKMPSLAIMEIPALNAFACGRGQDSAVIVVTRGLLQSLDDEELEAVIAHEVVHILRDDIKTMAVANVMLSTLFWVKRNNPLRIENHNQIVLILLLPPFLILFLTGGLITSIALTLAKLSRLLIASSREFIADAEAVRLTKNPAALISALQKVHGRSTIYDLDPAVEAMMIDGAVEGTYASHPTIADRIAVLRQHVGVMAHGAGIRKDTRSATEIALAQQSVFASRPHAFAAPPQKKLLIDRVNAGSEENAFGLKPAMRTALIFGLVGMAALHVVGLQSSTFGLTDFKGTAEMLGRPFRKVEPVKISPTAWKDDKTLTGRALVKALEAGDPLETRCYATGYYRVGERGFHHLYEPKEAVIDAHLDGTARSGGVNLEKYLAMRLKAQVRAWEGGESQREEALWGYVGSRGTVLRIVHWFYGDAGLDYMQRQYRHEADRVILVKIRERLLVGGFAERSGRERAELKLLVQDPYEYIPCTARALRIIEADGGRQGAQSKS